jgi:predicted dipeptidase
MSIKKNVAELKEEMILALSEWIQVPSVLDELDEKTPFGAGIDTALKQILNRCARLGFRTFMDPEGYYGYAEIGEGKEMIGILGHVDVVPAGDPKNWTYPPFGGAVENGKIYGRGAMDDKGPIIAAVYAAKALMNTGVLLNKRIRFIFGTDEENRWRGICRYKKNEELPTFGFTPDSSFPVIYAEKGLCQVVLSSDFESDFSMSGGTAINAVPEIASYEGDKIVGIEKQLKQMGFDHETEGDALYVIGKSAHAAKPNAGINAILRLASALNSADIHSPAIDFISEKIGFTTDGSLIFGDCSDDVSGTLTCSVNQIDISQYGEKVAVDFRIPVTVDPKFILDGLARVSLKYGLSVEILDEIAPLYLPKRHVLINRLSRIYFEETGLDSEPLATGGATYARAMSNIVAYGPLFPGQEKRAHQTDEFIEISALVTISQIYARAIESLLKDS